MYCVLPKTTAEKNLIGENRCQFFEDRTVTLLLIIDFFSYDRRKEGGFRISGQKSSPYDLRRCVCI
jgi:hypothetical protein